MKHRIVAAALALGLAFPAMASAQDKILNVS